MSNRPLRKRIPYRKQIKLESMPEDSEFIPNKSSFNARKIIDIDHKLTIELWYDKHYYERHFLGDETGNREGIDPATIETCVTKAMGHLFLYSSAVKGFKFVNSSKPTDYEGRLVIKQAFNSSILNIVIEVHFLSLNRYEVTVITAMVVDDFKMPSGQYCVKIHQDHSFLQQLERGQFLDLCSFRFA
jgi:hypothetical protein